MSAMHNEARNNAKRVTIACQGGVIKTDVVAYNTAVTVDKHENRP